MSKFYPIFVENVGPNDHGALNKRIRILHKPAHTNLSGEVRTEGWLGTTNDWSKTALGELDSNEVIDLLRKEGVKIPNDFVITAGMEFAIGQKQ